MRALMRESPVFTRHPPAAQNAALRHKAQLNQYLPVYLKAIYFLIHSAPAYTRQQ